MKTCGKEGSESAGQICVQTEATNTHRQGEMKGRKRELKASDGESLMETDKTRVVIR